LQVITLKNDQIKHDSKVAIWILQGDKAIMVANDVNMYGAVKVLRDLSKPPPGPLVDVPASGSGVSPK
jgi:hypothetical protein